MNEDTRLQLGLQTRREVLGAEHVDRSLAQASDFSRPMQELVTEYCWGAVWSRPGLDRKVRSLLNIVMLTALGRRHELEIHVRGAVTNGVSAAEIQEALLQAAVYCGVPAAMDAMRTAEATLTALGVTEPPVAEQTPA
jgi:4-carboxymuconolactone decarboxylase